MVKVINAHLREGDKGNYVSLELQGDVVLLQSQNTGRFYATAMKCFMFSTFGIEDAKTLIGAQLPGKIVKVACAPYDYTVKNTGEILQLAHTYGYVPHEGAEPQYEKQQPKEGVMAEE